MKFTRLQKNKILKAVEKCHQPSQIPWEVQFACVALNREDRTRRLSALFNKFYRNTPNPLEWAFDNLHDVSFSEFRHIRVMALLFFLECAEEVL